METEQTEYRQTTPHTTSGPRRTAVRRVLRGLGKNVRKEFLRSVLLVALAFVLAYLLQAPIAFSASFLSSQPSDDFDFPDFYNMVANNRPVIDPENDIVVVNIDGLDRYEIGTTLKMIGNGNPRAVGIDVLFQEPHDSLIDEWLVSSIRELPNVVLSQSIRQCKNGTFAVAERSFFADSIGEGIGFGAATFKAKVVGGRIREFTTYFPAADSIGTITGFATALAEKAYPEAIVSLKNRDKRDEIIDYPSRYFPIYTLRDIAMEPELVADKVVLVGVVSPLEDTHPTPIDDKMPGVLIHAHSLSTIIHGNYVNRLGDLFAWLIAIVLAWLIIMEFCIFKPEYKGVVLRVTQILLLFLALYLGYRLFVDHRLVIDFAPTVLMITFALFACDLQLGTFSFCKWTYKNLIHPNKK